MAFVVTSLHTLISTHLRQDLKKADLHILPDELTTLRTFLWVSEIDK